MHTSYEIDFFAIILRLIGGLVLFIYGVNLLGDKLKELAGENMRKFLSRFTKNSVSGVATGTVATAIMDSSSAVIIMVISLVNAGLLTAVESYGVVMGANIGTTLSSQIIALDIMEYSPIILLIGFLVSVAGKNEVRKKVGSILFGAGLIFFGLWQMDISVEPLHNYPPFFDLMKNMQNPLMGALAGALVTFAIQSSSATVGIAIILSGQGLITIDQGLAVMLGAEIGTCSDTLIAVIGRSKEAVRTGIFHLTFNIISVTFGLVLFTFFSDLVMYISAGASPERTIANGHMIFNIGGVLIFMWFIPYAHRLMLLIVPSSKKKK